MPSFVGADWARPVALTPLSVVAVGLLSLHFLARFRAPLRNWIDHAATRVKLTETRGAARLHTKTVEEMAADREASAALADAADKGKMTKE